MAARSESCDFFYTAVPEISRQRPVRLPFRLPGMPQVRFRVGMKKLQGFSGTERKRRIMEDTFHQQGNLYRKATPPMGMTNEINVGKLERLVSAGLGMGLLCGALRSNGFLKYAAILGAGGYLIYRGVSGNCPLSSFLGVKGGAGVIAIKSRLTVDRPRDAVYAIWRKLENLPRFMRHLERVEATDAVRSHWTARFPGTPAAISWNAEIVGDEEGSVIAWRSLPGSTIENAGEVRFRDAPEHPGTEVTVDISYRAPAGNLGEGIARLLNPVLENLIREDILNFREYAESGEIPAVKNQGSAGKTD